MAKHKDISIAVLVADPSAVFDRVEQDHVTLSVMRGEEIIAVISPTPASETLADLHRAMMSDEPDSSFYLDAMETRRLLGL
jgi:hypothetical protein